MNGIATRKLYKEAKKLRKLCGKLEAKMGCQCPSCPRLGTDECPMPARRYYQPVEFDDRRKDDIIEVVSALDDQERNEPSLLEELRRRIGTTLENLTAREQTMLDEYITQKLNGEDPYPVVAKANFIPESIARSMIGEMLEDLYVDTWAAQSSWKDTQEKQALADKFSIRLADCGLTKSVVRKLEERDIVTVWDLTLAMPDEILNAGIDTAGYMSIVRMLYKNDLCVESLFDVDYLDDCEDAIQSKLKYNRVRKELIKFNEEINNEEHTEE